MNLTMGFESKSYQVRIGVLGHDCHVSLRFGEGRLRVVHDGVVVVLLAVASRPSEAL